MVVKMNIMYSDKEYIIESDDSDSLLRVLVLAEGSGIRTRILNALSLGNPETERLKVAGTNYLVSDFFPISSGIAGIIASAVNIQEYFKEVKRTAAGKSSLLDYNEEYILPKENMLAYTLSKIA